MSYIDEAQVEIVTVDDFRALGYQYLSAEQAGAHGPEIATEREIRQEGPL
jgi:hypothetical protein